MTSKLRKKLALERPIFESFEEENPQNFPSDDEENSQDLPSFKSVIFKPKEDQNLFFDAEKGQFVNVDNFAFANSTNHFESETSSSSLALLDSKILDETSILDDSKIIVEELKKNLDSSSSQPNSLDASFEDSKPKIIKSPRDRNKSPPKRKTSLQKIQKLPSKSSSEDSSQTSKFSKNVAKNPGNSPVAKKLNLDKNFRKLGQNKSHSANNLHKLSVKDYHESFQLRRNSVNTT